LAGDLGDAIASFPLYKEKYGDWGNAWSGGSRRKEEKFAIGITIQYK
jgi:hypothetical protein